jgi:alanyl-tRNA synthetase
MIASAQIRTSSQVRKDFLDFFKSKQHTIVPSSSLMPDSPNLLFTNAGMNQFVPIFLGQTKCPYKSGRAADTQKCIRAGGKHNDLEDVGLDTYHHTFFEMLGNWSFGDYFKKESLEWGWELLTKVWKFPANRLYATVYKPGKGEPSEFDQETYGIWVEIFKREGLDPKKHIVYGNKKDNFWMMGDTGPCGPCSEIHCDLTPAGDSNGKLVNAGSPQCIEIWNHVFMQFNANPDGTFTPLPAKNVDTGMGFERVTSIIQCTKGFKDFTKAKISNYETDIFRPIFDELEKLSGKKYTSTLPGGAHAPSRVDDRALAVGAGEYTRPRVSTTAPSRSASKTSGITETKYSRRNLPHFERPWTKYMVTFSTHERRHLSPSDRDLVIKSVLYAHEQRQCQLYAACVMPDHVHLLFEPQIKEQNKEGKPVFWSLGEILQGIKSTSAHNINKASGKKEHIWEKESMDRMIRGQSDMEEKFHYICRNPWDAGVVPQTENYSWLWTPAEDTHAKSAVGEAPTAAREGACAPPEAAATLPQSEQEKIDIAFRVVADHIRTLGFAIADGIQPGNNDRNYVLRRILRRAVRYGRTLGFHEPFFYKLVDVLADTMGDVFPEIRAEKKHVQDVIRTEEEAFNKTLDIGISMFNVQCAGLIARSLVSKETEKYQTVETQIELIAEQGWDAMIEFAKKTDSSWNVSRLSAFSGENAFLLYDTYGFPLDLTELMAREHGLTVGVASFNKLMEEQRTRARAAQKKTVISLSQIETTTPTKFVGYEKLETPAKVLEVVSLKDKTAVILDISACYAEMGGQVGDTGELKHGSQLWRIVNTQKSGNTWLHFIEGEHTRPRVSQSAPSPIASVRAEDAVGGAPTAAPGAGALPISGSTVILSVDQPRRNAIQRHHTVTHLLHWALHEVVSKETSQKGSFVGPDKLTFDFNSAPLTPQQVADVEKLVNERIVENAPVTWLELPYAEVKKNTAITQFFGEKYGDTVRVLQIGGERGKLNGYSMELCGGTHVRATGEIGLFRIVGESAIAAGVRRIEAVAGLEAYRQAAGELQLIKSLAGKVNSPVGELEKKIESLLENQKAMEKQLGAAQQREASNAASRLLEEIKTINSIPAIIHNLGAVDGDFLQAVADSLKSRFKGVIVLGGGPHRGSVALIAAVTPDFTAKVQAGKIIQQIAPIVGGKGGGKPDNARGGGKVADKLDEALAKAKTLLG